MGKKLMIAVALCQVLSAQSGPPKRDSDPWKSLRFLIGTWQAKTQGGSAGATAAGTYTFRLELRGHVLARHTTSAGCKGPADFDCEHGDLLYVYPDSSGNGLKAVYFDNEGHVIHYNVVSQQPQSVIFLSDQSEPGPQFRLTYELRERVLYGRFQIRMPGQNDFTSYLEWSGPSQ